MTTHDGQASQQAWTSSAVVPPKRKDLALVRTSVRVHDEPIDTLRLNVPRGSRRPSGTAAAGPDLAPGRTGARNDVHR